MAVAVRGYMASTSVLMQLMETASAEGRTLTMQEGHVFDHMQREAQFWKQQIDGADPALLMRGIGHIHEPARKVFGPDPRLKPSQVEPKRETPWAAPAWVAWKGPLPPVQRMHTPDADVRLPVPVVESDVKGGDVAILKDDIDRIANSMVYQGYASSRRRSRRYEGFR